MMRVASLTFNPFQENTYIVFDETKECIIFDPGCYDETEKMRLVNFIEQEGLKPIRLINTHCHIDHVLGNRFVAEKYNLGLEIHRGELPVLESTVSYGAFFGLTVEPSPEPSLFLEEGDMVTFGNSELEVLFTPGHSPASISFFSKKDNILIAGDVLFYLSIGRTDLPGGNHAMLIKSIREKILPLGDEVIVYSGHGPKTNIGFERMNNPFLK